MDILAPHLSFGWRGDICYSCFTEATVNKKKSALWAQWLIVPFAPGCDLCYVKLSVCNLNIHHEIIDKNAALVNITGDCIISCLWTLLLTGTEAHRLCFVCYCNLQHFMFGFFIRKKVWKCVLEVQFRYIFIFAISGKWILTSTELCQWLAAPPGPLTS